MTPHTPGTDKTILWLISGFSVIVLLLIGVVAANEQNQARRSGQITTYKKSDTDKPSVSAPTYTLDIGPMGVNDEKSTDFILTNTGTKPLELFNMTSSCGCTAGVVTINGVKSPEGTMHKKSTWKGEVPPGGTATLTVIYRPKTMPVNGAVDRAVYIETNDPEKKELTFTVKAYVE